MHTLSNNNLLVNYKLVLNATVTFRQDSDKISHDVYLTLNFKTFHAKSTNMIGKKKLNY